MDDLGGGIMEKVRELRGLIYSQYDSETLL